MESVFGQLLFRFEHSGILEDARIVPGEGSNIRMNTRVGRTRREMMSGEWDVRKNRGLEFCL